MSHGRPPLAPPPLPLLRVELYPTQLAALARAPLLRTGHQRKSLRRARTRLEAARAGVELHGIEGPLERLCALVGSARSAAFRELADARIRELLAFALVWRAVEELPDGDVKAALMMSGACDEPGWMAAALDITAAVSLRVVLPGDDMRPGVG